MATTSYRTPPERTYLIMYDIRDPKRLRHVHKLCKKYGLPQQYSVFEARLTQRKFLTFIREISPWVHRTEDQLVCMPICEACRKNIQTLGQTWDFSHEASCIIV
ncbi:MAG: CRISPR-associated endonuclease Cas2 [Candidatus Melainabacteria bacterium]|nr:CRISPR-associated endonuclease Cas2 [Candidatus Melainabacteria bacterium]